MYRPAFTRLPFFMGIAIAVALTGTPNLSDNTGAGFISKANAQFKSSGRSFGKFRNNRTRGFNSSTGLLRSSNRGFSNRRNSTSLFRQRRNNINRINERTVIKNQLQSAQRTGSLLAKPGRFRNFGNFGGFNNFGNGFNSGFFLQGKRRDPLFFQRQFDIARRNDRVVLENALQAERRSGAVLANPNLGVGSVPVLDSREGILTAGVGDSGIAGPVSSFVTPCPSKHNCGYRVYTNGTGPRIITPGISAGNGLPEFDGISGPSIITPYN